MSSLTNTNSTLVVTSHEFQVHPWCFVFRVNKQQPCFTVTNQSLLNSVNSVKHYSITFSSKVLTFTDHRASLCSLTSTPVGGFGPLCKLPLRNHYIMSCLVPAAEVYVGKPGSGIWRPLERSGSSLPAAGTGECETSHRAVARVLVKH